MRACMYMYLLLLQITYNSFSSAFFFPTIHFCVSFFLMLGVEENMQDVVGHITEGVCRPLKVSTGFTVTVLPDNF